MKARPLRPEGLAEFTKCSGCDRYIEISYFDKGAVTRCCGEFVCPDCIAETENSCECVVCSAYYEPDPYEIKAQWDDLRFHALWEAGMI